MNEVKQIGNLTENPKRDNPQTYRVYDKEGISPTLNCMQGGNLQPMIIEDFYKNREPRVYDKTSPTIRAEREGLKVIEEQPVIIGSLQKNAAIKTDGICSTLTEAMGKGGGQIPMIFENKTYLENAIEQIIEKNNGEIPEAWDLYNKNPINNGISKTLGADCGHTGTAGATAVTHNYRIRKLTPKECWRLMGFTDEDFYKAEQVNSNSQLYKQAGNSIVVEVLEGIFKQMF